MNRGKEHPTVFISYSHDERPAEHMDKVLAFSNQLRKDGINTVLDQYEESPPEGWPMWMDRQIQMVDFVLMICTETYYKRVMGEEEMGTGRGVKWEGRLIYQHFYNSDGLNKKFIPVLFSYCNGKHIPTPFQSDTYYMVDDKQRYERLYARLTGREYIERPDLGKIRPLEEKARKTDFFAVKTMLSKLPVTGKDLFGRENELKILDDAWANEKTKIISFVAWGGVGKTALVNEWLNRMGEKNWGGAERVYGWSFYSQGTTEDRQASSDTFLANALEWFGDKETAASAKSPWNKGVRLAELIREQKTLLILDGVEPLQYPPGPMKGRLKDQGLQALLRELSHGMNGLCVITTREDIKDLEHCVGHSVKLVELENLSPEAGMQVLQEAGVSEGTDEELKKASKEFGGHALTLNLLGRYLAKRFGGEIRERDKIPKLAYEKDGQGKHAQKVMEAYEIWLKGTAELNILYLMGLFDRPVEEGAIEALKKEPAIKGLTEQLQKISDEDWDFAVENLRDLRLLGKGDESGVLDCHPLVREHFGEKLKKENPEAWREAHSRLYEYYKGLPEKLYKKFLPDTTEEMEPLFRAVYHGCAAGKHQETFDDVYQERIYRDNEKYIVYTLSAFGSDLGAVACFFEKIWDRPAAGLSEYDKGIVLNVAGHALRAVGRLRESAEPMESATDNAVKGSNWDNAAIGAGNLSELYLTLGEVEKAVEYGHRCVEYADKSGYEFHRSSKRTTLADAFHQAREIERAKRLFEEAEGMQKKGQPEYRYLYSLWGYRYCDFLLAEGKTEEVKERAEWSIEIAKRNRWLLDIAMDKLSLGRAYLAEAASKIKEQKSPRLDSNVISRGKNIKIAEKYLNEAVDGLRKVGAQEFISQGLLARAEYYRVAGEYGKAWEDLEEVKEIAERGEMKLHLADYHLEAGRLCKAEGKDAKEHIQAARELINTCGYHRRDKELEELE